MLNLPRRTNFNEIAKLILLVQANASEIVVCKMAPVLSRPQCVNINDVWLDSQKVLLLIRLSGSSLNGGMLYGINICICMRRLTRVA